MGVEYVSAASGISYFTLKLYFTLFKSYHARSKQIRRFYLRRNWQRQPSTTNKPAIALGCGSDNTNTVAHINVLGQSTTRPTITEPVDSAIGQQWQSGPNSNYYFFIRKTYSTKENDYQCFVGK